ncbi:MULTISPECIES: GMC family oxidoreductase [unclassified Rhizobacter]|uniref:GMC family oxidoreductase n=1 Tax=unclassified Rhizobacter TaxID=2640088 RepID=UPI0006F38719|nr:MULTISPECIES: GMC family oxidoreductase [unclassified Rhizobacter]KQU75175.1 GMC family oxidoreductase [Rhizobacter sp. Root29]KQW01161.1 GMC family oxidoreductase [Rhizobacter sp. Root1238]KRB15159.1 GMC family oxidoreductase [Rhizobacter sp. Root16D2]
MSHFDDPIQQGLQRGWHVFGGPHGPVPATLSCDVAIVGSGAGAGITAELLTKAGLQVVIVEEGPLKSSRDFRQRESEAYPSLYQESAARKTADKAINILQGRCVGGSTTVNWTSSFRTPVDTLAHWQSQFGLAEMTAAAMTPWFEQAERRLNIGPWLAAPNRNNELLRTGATKLGIPASAIQRNVKGCWNLGSCGMGCPTNAKQSMLVTTLPAALDGGATLLVQMRAERLESRDGVVQALHCAPVSDNSAATGGAGVRITAKHYVVAGGAINSPALLLRSGTPDPHGLVGKRTFLHPVVISAANFADPVNGWDGAPQTLYTDHFLQTQPLTGPIGYKLEAPPLHPVILASTLAGHGRAQAEMLAEFPRTHGLLALMRDGFHAESPGGSVALRGDGTPILDYPLNDFVMDGARRAFLSMAEIQFAAGARSVMPVHESAVPTTSWAEARRQIEALPMKPLLTRVVSAHVMGGCPMAGSEAQGVVRPDGTHWQLANLSVHDGSLFPTSIGANPQLSVYGLATMLATRLAKRLTGRDVQLA